jgi:Zn-dependent protease with chaperone function
MFYLLCFCLVFAVMFVVVALVTLVSMPALRGLTAFAGRIRAGRAANFLFIFRALPFMLGIVASIGLVLPAFLEFEPYSTHERPGLALLVLAGLGLFIMLAMAWRCWRIVRETWNLQRRWLKNAAPLMAGFKGIPVFCVQDSASLVAVAGIFVPRIFISQNVANALNGAELEAALSHELAHIGARDNFKQFVLKMTQAPRFLRSLAAIDSLWTGTAELAADERAIAHGASALELSSALVKVGRLSFEQRSPLLAASHLVEGCSSATSARVGHLRHLLELGISQEHAGPADDRPYRWLSGAAIALIFYLLVLGTVLPQIHEALEFIVR